jgi:hypothetical protein
LSSDLYVVTCVHLFFFFFLHSSIERSFIYQLNLISQFRENLIQDWKEVIFLFLFFKKKHKKKKKKKERKRNWNPSERIPISQSACNMGERHAMHFAQHYILFSFSAASCLHRITYGLLNFFFTFSESPSSLSLPLPISVSQCLFYRKLLSIGFDYFLNFNWLIWFYFIFYFLKKALT